MDPTGRQDQEDCRVCSRKTNSHVYYGAIVCKSCRAFFRRCITVGNKDRLNCLSDAESCSLVATHYKCPSCRLKKCFEVGMKESLIRGPNESLRQQRQRSKTSNRVERVDSFGYPADHSSHSGATTTVASPSMRSFSMMSGTGFEPQPGTSMGMSLGGASAAHASSMHQGSRFYDGMSDSDLVHGPNVNKWDQGKVATIFPPEKQSMIYSVFQSKLDQLLAYRAPERSLTEYESIVTFAKTQGQEGHGAIHVIQEMTEEFSRFAIELFLQDMNLSEVLREMIVMQRKPIVQTLITFLFLTCSNSGTFVEQAQSFLPIGGGILNYLRAFIAEHVFSLDANHFIPFHALEILFKMSNLLNTSSFHLIIARVIFAQTNSAAERVQPEEKEILASMDHVTMYLLQDSCLEHILGEMRSLYGIK